MGEAWKILGQSAQVPVFVTGSLGIAGGGAGGTSFVQLTGTNLTEEAFSSSNNGNSLSEYFTVWTAANQGFESASVVKASPGKLYQVIVSNPSSQGMYYQIFDRVTSPPGGAMPSASIYVGPSSSLNLSYRSGRAFGVGITVGMSALYSAFSGANSGSFQIFYK